MDDRAAGIIRTTGVGSMPGTDSDEAARVAVGEWDIPHLVELPARGPGADMIGRTLALLNEVTGDFAGETTPSGWRLVGGRTGGEPGRQMRRGASWLAEDLDRLEQQLAGFTGTVKVQLAGPWTVAAALESAQGIRVVADPGTCRDLADAMAEALAEHLTGLRRRVPAAALMVQVDEPMLPQVVAGQVRTPSGRGALRVPDAPELSGSLSRVVAGARAAGAAGVLAHCCARQVPFDLLAGSGFSGVSVDVGVLGGTADEALGAWWDQGGHVALGVVAAVDPPAGGPPAAGEAPARTVAALWNRVGFGVEAVGARTWLTPACGLAGASPAWVRTAARMLRRSARLLESAE
jgi:hypothetical protein